VSVRISQAGHREIGEKRYYNKVRYYNIIFKYVNTFIF